MAVYVISDIHIKPDGKNEEILRSFFELNYIEGDVIFLLGDIFDLMVGPYAEYEEQYFYFFTTLEVLKKRGITIHYFEGNHDFHLNQLFLNKGVILHTKPFIYEHEKRRILMCHGDEIEIGNYSYKIYKIFIRSAFFKMILNYLMSYKMVGTIGHGFSKKSRERNEMKYRDYQKNDFVKDKFRKSAKIAACKYKTEVVICGHSHYKDDFFWDQKRYLNCGFLPQTSSYIKIDEEIQFIKL